MGDDPDGGARRRALPLVLAASAVAALALALLAWTPGGEEPGVESVAFLGDSITAGAREELEWTGDGRAGQVTVEATSGAMSREQMDDADAIAAASPSVVVVNLGTNDAACVLSNDLTDEGCRYPGFTNDDLRADLAAIARSFDPDETCIVGVHPTFSREPAVVWEELVERGEAAGLVAWGPESRRREGLLRDELGHLTDAGNEAYAELLWDGIERICG